MPNDPITLHKYLYAGNDPVQMVDPSGNFFTLSSLGSGISNLGRLAVSSVRNVSGAVFRSLSRTLKSIGSKVKNRISPKKKTTKKGRKDNEEPNSLHEALVLVEAILGAGKFIQPKPGKPPLADTPRLNAVWQEGIWIKMEPKRKLQGGKKTVIIHWFRNTNTGLDVEFKFKRRK